MLLVVGGLWIMTAYLDMANDLYRIAPGQKQRCYDYIDIMGE